MMKRSGTLDTAEAREAQMGTGDHEPLVRNPIEHALARRRREVRIDIVDQPGLGARQYCTAAR